ncbi:ribbon-helix-helix domain-containing protein [Nocardia sp. NPDC050378]|uniref:ribbon-helix-helix domain-containing protein n=1 Tax=Nocardia sp. NPDC050378 TaxID=3155400 RepID=UPI0033DF2507
MNQDKLNELRDYYDNNETQMDSVTGPWEPEDARPTGERMSGFSVRLPAEVLERVRALAADRGLSTGEWIRQVVEAAVTASDTSTPRVVDVNELLAFLAEKGHAA